MVGFDVGSQDRMAWELKRVRYLRNLVPVNPSAPSRQVSVATRYQFPEAYTRWQRLTLPPHPRGGFPELISLPREHYPIALHEKRRIQREAETFMRALSHDNGRDPADPRAEVESSVAAGTLRRYLNEVRIPTKLTVCTSSQSRCILIV